MVRSQFRARSGDGVKRSPNENPATATVETTGQLEVAVEAPHNNIVFILLSVPLMISTNTFAYLAKNPETGKYDHNVPTVTLLAEVTKAILSLLQLAGAVGIANIVPALSQMPARRAVLYLVPAICHCITNNFHFLSAAVLNPVTKELLEQLKIFTMALGAWLCFRRVVTVRKLIALVLLVLGVFMCLLSNIEDGEIELPTLRGFCQVLFTCCVSTLASLWTEWLLKDGKDVHIGAQNFCLYIFGIICNGLVLGWTNRDAFYDTKAFFHGYSRWTWLLVGVYSVYGLALSLLMKYGDSMLRVFAKVIALAGVAFVSRFLFKFEPSLLLLASVVMVSAATLLYYAEPRGAGKRD